MRSFRRLLGAAALLAAGTLAPSAAAQQAAQGFALDRFYGSAPGGGWFVMDALDMRGGLGGAMELTTDYALQPLRVTDGVRHLTAVSDQVITDLGFAATYDRFRLYLNLDAPLLVMGQSGTVGNYTFTAPSLDLGSHPDTLADARLGFDARVLGEAHDAFRLGASAQVFIPPTDLDGSIQGSYLTDGTLRAMGRVLVAGDLGWLSYAGHLGVHVRPLDDSPAPGAPRGSELLFGLAGGARMTLPWAGSPALIVGPEVFGATAFRSLLGTNDTALEGLVTGRIEGTADSGAEVRVKLGTGGGLDARFGAPEWRVVFAVEVFDHGGRRAP